MFKKLMYVLSMLTFIFAISACSTQEETHELFDSKKSIVSQTDYKSYNHRDGFADQHDALVQFEKFDGSETLFTFSGEQSLSITVYQDISKGRFQVLLIDQYDRITVLRENHDLKCDYGTYRIKIIGDKAYGTVSIHIDTLMT